MYQLIFISFYIFYASGQQLCYDKNIVELTNETENKDGSFFKNGIRFSADFVFKRNISGEVKTYGCECENRKCFRKCCPFGQVMYKRKCVIFNETSQIKLNLYGDMNILKETIDLETYDFTFVYGLPCGGDVYIEPYDIWYMQEDGNLFVESPTSIPPWNLKRPNKYCIDNFVIDNPDGTRTTQLNALACFANEENHVNYTFSASCMLISCVFILATVAVYAWLPELRNLHGRVLMAYLLSLFVGFVCLATLQILLTIDNISEEPCLALTIIIYFSLLSAFFWMNVMSFDIWWTFSGNRAPASGKMSVRAKFLSYALYAFGIPTALTILVIALEFSGIPHSPYLPEIRYRGCFLSGVGKLIYLYGPMVILCCANIIFFILTTKKITEIKKETSVLKSKESATHDLQNKDKQRLFLYVKLFIVMGINWILEVISSAFPQLSIWYVTDTYNLLIGLFIFIIFVCKKKILYLMKKRYKQMRGRSMSRSQTTCSRTLSTRDEIALTQKN